MPQWLKLFFLFFVSLIPSGFTFGTAHAYGGGERYAFYDATTDKLCVPYEYSGGAQAIEIRYVTKFSYDRPGYNKEERRQEVRSYTKFLETRLATPPYNVGEACRRGFELRAAGVVALAICDQFGYIGWVDTTDFARILNGERLALVVGVGPGYVGRRYTVAPAPVPPVLAAPFYPYPSASHEAAPTYSPRPAARKHVRHVRPRGYVSRKPKVIIRERVVQEFVPYPVVAAPTAPPAVVLPNRPCPQEGRVPLWQC